jgi:hypothetical protein
MTMGMIAEIPGLRAAHASQNDAKQQTANQDLKEN